MNLRRRDGPPIVVGHRGAAAVAPENTLAALQVAVDAGAQLVEFDIGPDLQLAHSRREVPEDSLSLDEALAFLAEHEIGVHLDVKLPGYEQDVVDAIERHALGERAIVSTAFSRSSRRLAAIAPSLPRAIGYPRDSLGVARIPWPAGLTQAGATALRQAMPVRVPVLLRVARATVLVPPSHALLATRRAGRPRNGRAGARLDGQRPGRRPPARPARRRRNRLGRPWNGPESAGYTARAVKRLAAIGLFLLGLGCAGMFSGTVIADITTSTSATTTTGTTTAPTTTAATTTAVTTTAPPPGPPPTIPAGVRVAGVKVGGLTPAAAVKAVQTAYSRPLAIVVDRSRLVLEPRLFSSAYVSTAVAKARIAEPRSNVKLVVAVRGANVRNWVARVTKRFSRPSVDATLAFRGERPVIHGDRAGRSLNAKKLTQRIVAELASNSRLAVRVHTIKVAPTVSADAFAHVITINRSTNRLTLYDDGKLQPHVPRRDGPGDLPDAARHASTSSSSTAIRGGTRRPRAPGRKG